MDTSYTTPICHYGAFLHYTALAKLISRVIVTSNALNKKLHPKAQSSSSHHGWISKTTITISY
jgi:hypothetical protein